MYVGEERRLFHRVDVGLTVRCFPEGSRKEYCVSTENISGRGMKILISKKLTPGTVLDLEIFRNNSGGSAKGKGKVCWVSRMPLRSQKKKLFEAGIEFMDLSFLYISSLISGITSQNSSDILAQPTL